MYLLRDEYERSRNSESFEEIGAGFSPLSRGWNRRTEFLKDTCKFIESEDQYQEILNTKTEKKNFFLRYLLNPVELIGNPETNRIQKVKV